MAGIYEPGEDSYLMSDFLMKMKIDNKQEILEIGSGSGVQAQTLIKKGVAFENLVLSDIDKDAVGHLKKNFPESKVVLSDLFSDIKGKFDIIIFNPPYLPVSCFDDKKDTTGGKKGSETINKFLCQAKKHLKKKGKVFLITSSLTRGIKWRSFDKKILSARKLFFERLYLWELKP